MPESLKEAIAEVTRLLAANGLDDNENRARRIVDALETVNARMGLKFTENLLANQLRSVNTGRGYINFINLLGLALYRQVQYELAIACFRFRIERNPRDKVAYNNMGLSYNRLGKSRQAAEAYGAGLAADPDYKQAGSNLLYLEHYIWGADPAKLATQHRDYGQRHYSATDNLMAGRLVDLNPERLLKIGLLSGDLRFHAVSRFVEGIFDCLDRNGFSLYIYHTYSGAEDTITASLRQYDLQWSRVHKLTPEQQAHRIQEDGIDILLDLAIYTQGGCPDVMALQVAPIQVNYLGYPDTSGIPAIQYRITDPVSDPEGSDEYYSEKLLRLPVPLWTYRPWPNVPALEPTPCESNGYLTFGSMNNHAKLQPEWLRIWAKVLSAVPHSVLLIKSRAMGSERIAEEVFRLFESRGISRRRIIARGFEKRPNDHFLTFQEIDICLDSLPYNGTTTTFDALWMGVPVVTLSGNIHVSRTSASILHGMGLDDLVATTPTEFVNICRQLADDTDRLQTMRRSLRRVMTETSLGDAEKFCRHLESMLRQIWRDFCANPSHGVIADNPRTNDAVDAAETAETPAEISIVVCAADGRNLEIHREHIADTIGVPWEYIGIDNSVMQFSLARAYNEGARLATAPLIVFVHDDVFFATPDWGKLLREKFREDPALGLLGVAGSSYFDCRHPYWVAAREPFIQGQIIHHFDSARLSRYSNLSVDAPVVALDGLMLATTADIWSRHPFDQDTFDGFHFYDLDFSLRVSETADVRVTPDILLKHLSGGNFGDEWAEYRNRFREKYAGKGPWSSKPGRPEPGSHRNKLHCHYPLKDFFQGDILNALLQLGSDHPKHPANRS